MKTIASAICLGLFLLAGLAGCGGGPSDTGGIDAGVTFRPAGFTRALSCSAALVANVRLQFFDEALSGLLRGEITRPCLGGERYRVVIERGGYLLKVQGLNFLQTVCYEAQRSVPVPGGRAEVVDLVADQHPMGALGGCQYPTAP